MKSERAAVQGGKMTRKELAQVYHLAQELKMREKQLNELIQSSQISSPQITGMPFANTNETSDKVADTAVKIITYTEQVNVFKEALKIRKEAIDRWTMSLEDSYLRQIVHYRCYELLSWTKIAQLLNSTPDSLRMYYNRSIPEE